jgi:ribosomal protein S18 acetylase RimI-like enzyme
MSTIRLLEELSLNAMPALQTRHYDGWELRFSNGYPRRANSIQVLYPSLMLLEEKITFCEAQYDARGLKTVFKMMLAATDGLEAALRARGYIEDAVTSVQTLDLAGFDAEINGSVEVVVESQISDAWYEDFARLNEKDPIRAATTRLLLERVAVECVFMRLRLNGETVALGRGVLDLGWIGFYEIATDERYRQQGLGSQLMLNILHWGKQKGAHSAYLQVMVTNPPALRLYEKLGFQEQYRYGYLQNRL